VLPREVSARVITSSFARASGAVNAVSLALAIPLLIEYMAVRGLALHPPVPFLILVVLVALSVVTAVVPRPIVVVLFLIAGSVGAVLFQVILIGVYPPILDEALYLLNRPAVALVLVGVAATTVRGGVLWSVGGFALSILVTGAVAVIAHVPFSPGFGPLFALLLMLTAYGALAVIQRRLRRRVPDFATLEENTRQLALQENLRLKVTAAVHDTLLNDLSLVMNSPDELNEAVTSRLRDDLATLTGAEWLEESAGVIIDDQDSWIRNQVMQVISALQWRGLTVHVTGNGPGIYKVSDELAGLIVDVVRVCLENVLRHSGVSVAEVDLVYGADGVTAMITDQGVGFDPAAVAADRLGLRNSVIERVERAGGSVTIWSSPGNGTSVVINLPVIEILTEHEESDHGRS